MNIIEELLNMKEYHVIIMQTFGENEGSIEYTISKENFEKSLKEYMASNEPKVDKPITQALKEYFVSRETHELVEKLEMLKEFAKSIDLNLEEVYG